MATRFRLLLESVKTCALSHFFFSLALRLTETDSFIGFSSTAFADMERIQRVGYDTCWSNEGKPMYHLLYKLYLRLRFASVRRRNPHRYVSTD